MIMTTIMTTRMIMRARTIITTMAAPTMTMIMVMIRAAIRILTATLMPSAPRESPPAWGSPSDSIFASW